MEEEEIVTGLTLELRRGSLVLCTLSLLRQAQYGYSLVKELGERGIPIQTNTLYPLLRRLEEQGLLSGTWNTDGAKPRKYYELTQMGRSVYEKLMQHWGQMAQTIVDLREENL